MTTVLCYGDSNTYGYNPRNGFRYGEDIRWTSRLQALLGREEYRVIEEGCNGRTTIHDDPIDGWKNGLDYLKPCLNSHKPIDVVILMLGSNDLKSNFHLGASDIADGAGVLVKTIQSFTEEKQGFKPVIILVSPPEIGHGIHNSPFYGRFLEDAISRSQEFSKYYRAVSECFGCVFFDAAEWIKASEIDSLHLDPDSHKILAEKLADVVKGLKEKECKFMGREDI